MNQISFNLIEEPWIPVADFGLASLREVFTDPSLISIGGNPVDKISILKLLLAIAQAAYTPANIAEWQESSSTSMAHACMDYLDKWHDHFDLFGETPFLQMKGIKAAPIKSFGAVIPSVATGNTTVLTSYNNDRILTNAEMALALITQMSMALGGKKPDNSVVLSKGYKGKSNSNGKPSTSKPGPGIEFLGLQHSFAIGKNLLETIWVNLLTRNDIDSSGMYPVGLGYAPWESMPVGEDCENAQLLKSSLMGRLIPMSRFCLIANNGIHLSEGIQHPNYKSGVVDPTITFKPGKKELKPVWFHPQKKAWRTVMETLGHLTTNPNPETMYCYQLKCATQKLLSIDCPIVVWSGGVKVRTNAGEQYFSGDDDMAESMITLPYRADYDDWYESYKSELKQLDGLSKRVYGSVLRYYKSFNMKDALVAVKGSQMFWEYCDSLEQELLNSCDREDEMITLKDKYASLALQTYSELCHKRTARQISAWVKNKPYVEPYCLNKERYAP
ncbi:type I-E CRISPR-associated protein Cse1/CasA [Photobacterium leiognathi]|nr:type I-E CRISPR-associated protein Cse1/CasA [Photobacterium leiognathi]